MTFGLAALLVIAMAVWAWELDADRRAIERLPADERTTLFERTRANVDTLCRPDAERGAMRLCRQQAKMLLSFPECGAECRKQVQAILESATR